MNANAMLFALLALADLSLMAYMGRRRMAREAQSRMMAALRLAVQCETYADALVPQKRHLQLRRAG